MLVDHERAWLSLKAVIAEKRSHGQLDLLAEMSRLEVQNRIEEGLPERALRLYGMVFSDDLLRPSHEGARAPSRDGHADPLAAGKGPTAEKESHNGSEYPAVPSVAQAAAASASA